MISSYGASSDKQVINDMESCPICGGSLACYRYNTNVRNIISDGGERVFKACSNFDQPHFCDYELEIFNNR